MFGSKKNKTTSKVDVSINTMDDDTKGAGAKNISVEYNDSTNINRQTKQQSKAVNGNNTDDKNTPITDSNSLKKSTDGQNMTSPFENTVNDSANREIETPKPPNNDDMVPHGLPKGTFSTSNINTPTVESEKSIPSFATNNQTLNSQAKNSSEKPFLHQATDKINNRQAGQPQNNALSKNTSPKKSSISSIIWIIVFVLLLGTILLGAYYFYMKKNDSATTTPNKNKQEIPKKMTNASKVNNKQINTQTNTQTNSQVNQQTKPQTNNTNTQTKPTQTTSPTQQTLPTTFKTSEATFINDLGRFLLVLKNSGNEKTLRGGVIVTPMVDADKPLSAQELIKIMGMTNLLKETDLKPACKLFIMQDADKIRVALVFELANGVDDKIIKDNIIKNETDLPNIMKKLFVNEIPPTVPPTIKFSVNKDNLSSRYFNYKPGDTFTSNDWNILDLGQGKILYFATSKNLAEKVTNYFMKLVVK